MEDQDPNTTNVEMPAAQADEGPPSAEVHEESNKDEAMKSAAPASGATDEDDSEMIQQEAEAIPVGRNADLKLDDKKQVLKEYWNMCWADVQDNEFIDAMDTVQKWCLAQVISRDENGVRIHFDGWSTRHDVSYRWSSYKIAPFRRFSRGYTGQYKTPLR